MRYVDSRRGSARIIPDESLPVTPRWRGCIRGRVPPSAGGDHAAATIGGIFFGASHAAIPTPSGGTLLLNPLVTDKIPMPPAADGSHPLPIPGDGALCGAVVHAQAIHSDAGASAGVAFTPGPSITLGN